VSRLNEIRATVRKSKEEGESLIPVAYDIIRGLTAEGKGYSFFRDEKGENYR